MDSRYTISQLFELAFGVKNPVYLTVPIGKQKESEIVYPTPRIKTAEQEEVIRKSRLGTPVIFPVKFKGGSYRVYDGKGKIVQQQFEDFWFPPATMVDFSRPKNITKTDVLGGNGTVKEIFGFDDWNIRIRTLCIKDEFTAREYEKNIIEWHKVIQSIEVEGDLFVWKDIHNLVIEEMDIKSLEGSPNVIPIEMFCSSDEPFELIYKMD
ncbi:MAG: DUF6046 domain-containing protein [Bergeyella sp.]